MRDILLVVTPDSNQIRKLKIWVKRLRMISQYVLSVRGLEEDLAGLSLADFPSTALRKTEVVT